MKFSRMTFSIMRFNVMTLDIMTFVIMTVNNILSLLVHYDPDKMTFGLMTLDMKTLAELHRASWYLS